MWVCVSVCGVWKRCLEDINSGIAQKCKFFIWRPPLSFWQSDCPWYTHPSHATILLIRFLHEIYFFLWSSVVLWAEVGLLSVQLHWVGSASWMSSSFFLWQRFWDWVNMVQSMQFHTQSQNVEKYWYRFDILTKNKKKLWTRSSWLNCVLRDDEDVYWVSIRH